MHKHILPHFFKQYPEIQFYKHYRASILGHESDAVTIIMLSIKS